MSAKFPIEYWLTAEGLERVRLYSNDGLSQKQIAAQMGCSLSTLKKYAKESVELIQAINAGRDSLLTDIEISAYNQARGCYRTIVEYGTDELVDEDGETTKTSWRRERRVYFPPDFRATSFILRNARPEKWDKIKHETAQQKKQLFDRVDTIQVIIGGGDGDGFAE